MTRSLRDLGEVGLLQFLGPILRQQTEGLPLGTGDDVAITPGSVERLVWTIDTMIEGTHFRWWDHPLATPEALATKLFATNLSDLSSKGAAPLYSLVSLGVPGTTSIETIERFYKRLAELHDEFGARLIGGDTVKAPQWTLTLALVGSLSEQSAIAARSNAFAGQGLYVTGFPGESAAGFRFLEGTARADGATMRAMILRHLEPPFRQDVGIALAQAFGDLAMMDLSDGIAKDAGEIARTSRHRLVLESAEFPISDALRVAAGALGLEAEFLFLHGGEDYELLFATSAEPAAVVALCGEVAPGLRVTRIGFVEEGHGVVLRDADGNDASLDPKGFQHFA